MGPSHLHIRIVVVIAGFLQYCVPEKLDICPGEIITLQCPSGEVIIPEEANFGRMENGRCIEVNDLIGCSNDVLNLVDDWCAGKQNCDIIVPNADLKSANTDCLRYVSMYLDVQFSCLKVTVTGGQDCTGRENILVKESEGFLSSHVTDETGCGSTRVPWMLEALPGQTINFNLIDFNSDVQSNSTSPPVVYGYILDGATRHEISGMGIRHTQVYSSKTNTVKVQVAPQRGTNGNFILQFKKTGCPDLKPPAHAWYKRDGGQAVIGCEWSQKTWHLSCDGHSWSGVVGNCSEPTTQQPMKEEHEMELPSALLLTCVVSVAVVLAAVVLVCGVVCIKKFRIKHEIEKATTLPRQYGHYDMDPNIEMASMMYLPYKPCEHEGILVDVNSPVPAIEPAQGPTEISPIHIWQQPLPDVPPRVDNLTAATMPAYPVPSRRGRTPGDGDEGFSGHEDDTLRSGQSNFSSLNNHKYSALNTAPVH